MSGIGHKLLAASSGFKEPITLDSTTSDTNTDLTFPFNYGSSHPAGSFIVVVVSARSTTQITGSWQSLVDSEGNTFTLATQGTQLNNLTFSAIYFCVLANPVSSATTLTATATGPTSVSNGGRHAAVFNLSGVSDVENTVNTPTDGAPVTQSTTTVSGKGIAFHVVSTGFNNVLVTSVSDGFSLEVEIPTSSAQYIATSVFDKTPSDSVSNTFTMNTTNGRYANMMAIFE